ncbi:UbiA prenyltransferase family [Flammula alnicola]|nr:UbiA prenyltransferase family [Flammula alnicola]
MLKHVYTAILFTWTDFKTIFFPITVFACACAPFPGLRGLLECCAWIWVHLLMCNVSNQARTQDEDLMNRPWRPISSGRISASQAISWRYGTAIVCLLWSLVYGKVVTIANLILIITTLVYDELGGARHFIGKNLCGVFGYMSFEIGATAVMSRKPGLDSISMKAVLFSGMVVFTTLQAQDFADIAGDAAIGRMTLPIYAPELSRIATLLALSFWSVFLGWVWELGPAFQAGFVALGAVVGLRYYLYRTPRADGKSYILFNIWLLVVHGLPFYGRNLVPSS